MQRIFFACVFVIFCCCTNETTGQNVAAFDSATFDKLNRTYTYHFSRYSYDSALIYGQQIVDYSKKIFGTASPVYTTALGNLAFVQSKLYRFTDAEKTYEDALIAVKSFDGEQSKQYAFLLNNLAYIFVSVGKYDNAEKAYIKVIAIRKIVLGENTIEFATTLNDYGILKNRLGDYKVSDSLLSLSVSIKRNLLGEQNEDFLLSLNNLGTFYSTIGKYAAADSVFNIVLNARKKLFGAEDYRYAETLTNFADLKSTIGQLAAAELLLLEALDIFKKTIGETHLTYCIALNNLGYCYERLGKYQKAEQCYKSSIANTEKITGKYHSEYAQRINNLAALYDKMDRNTEAETLYKEALVIKKQIFKTNHKDVALAYLNIGFYYAKTGNYILAESAYLQAANIYKIVSGAIHADYAISLNNIGVLYLNMGNYEKAELMNKEALDIYGKVFGKLHNAYARSLANLATVYLRTADYNKAKPLFEEALEITEKTLGENHTDYAVKLNNLALLNENINDFTTAESQYKRVLTTYQSIVGDNHTDYALALNNLAFLYQKMGKCATADSLFNKALIIRAKVLGTLHPNYAININNLAGLYYTCNEPEKWNAIIANAIETDINSRQALLLNFSEAEKETYLKRTKSNIDANLSMLLYFKSKQTNPFYKMVTAEQGWLLQGKQLLNNLAASNNDTTVQQLYQKWLSVNKSYASAMQLTEEKRKQLNVNLDSLQALSQQLEKQLIAAIPALQSLLKSTGFTAKEIAPKLNNNEVVLHWVAFKYQSPKRWTDSTFYAAFIITAKDTTPTFVTVFEGKALSKLLQQYHGTSGRGAALINKKTPINVDAALYDLIWKPLLPHLNGIKKVYNLPSGLLHKVSFAALKDSVTGKSIIDDVELHQLLSIQQMLYANTSNSSNKNLALMGGALFDASIIADTTKSANSVLPNYRSSNSIQQANIKWSYLAGTQKEIDAVQQFALQSKWQVATYSAANATENNLKQLSGKYAPGILHLSTHGFYFPPPAETRDIKENAISGAKDFPLLRSGIVLSGVNNFWGKDTLLLHEEDGIVTAQEVSNLNLLQTNLVVLSACQTALGDISSNEGVYGLQRAFMLAGSKKLLMSLWEVPDAETAELMQLFYAAVFNGSSYYDALRSAQLSLKTKYKDPVKWAGFVLTGE